MSYFCDDVDAALGGLHTSAYTGLGLRGDQVPATGSDGPSALYPCITLPADAAVEVFAQLTRLPTLGVLVFEEDGSFVYTGATDYFEFRLWVDGVAATGDIGHGPGIVRVALNVGAAPASGFTDGATLGPVAAGGSLASQLSAFTGGGALAGVIAAGQLGPNASAFSAGAALGAVRAGGVLVGMATTVDRSGRIVIGIFYERKASTMAVATEVTPIDVDEVGKELKFDYADELPLGVTLQSAEIEVELLQGSNATPAAILNGALRLANGNTMVLQDVDGKGLLANYSVRCKAVGTDGDTYVLAIHLPVRTF